MIFDIQRNCLHDGPGIRTTVFLKGCPLRCIWCHNPESWSGKPDILFDGRLCTACGRCVPVCPEHCHSIVNGSHRFDRTACTGCGLCAEQCFTSALERCGRTVTPQEVMKDVLKDCLFYENTGGGLTISGGEPMMQFAFTRDLLKLAKGNGLHTCMETCGFARQNELAEILPLTDLFLYDIKTPDSKKHRRLTGQDNTLILNNLQFLNDAGAKIILRCPLVPGVNDSEEELAAIGRLAERLPQVCGVHLIPYHPLGTAKSERLGISNGFHGTFPSDTEKQKWAETISRYISNPDKKTVDVH